MARTDTIQDHLPFYLNTSYTIVSVDAIQIHTEILFYYAYYKSLPLKEVCNIYNPLKNTFSDSFIANVTLHIVQTCLMILRQMYQRTYGPRCSHKKHIQSI